MNSIQDDLRFDILQAPLAAIDRRVLSQAWFSALHLAHDHASHNGAAPGLLSAGNDTRRSPRASGRECAVERTSAERLPAPTFRETRVDAHDTQQSDRRVARSPLARKIERTFLRPNAARRSATFAVDGAGGRVHVVLQRADEQMRLVAICPPAVRERVEQALAQARYALALRGVRLVAEAKASAS